MSEFDHDMGYLEGCKDTKKRALEVYGASPEAVAALVDAAANVIGFLRQPPNSWATDVYPEGHQALDQLSAALAAFKKEENR